ncbi:MAG: ribosome maturation factor RimM [Massilibacteroides sp.]|nr:ribosome maturation factor RimM [Massilibacteroides sp.]MDD3062575.1 ribosome maturation factor RimM [Massilibacteroides sp.]MDD4116079.1 ribosome maturation factor RimM [Massilibacteroides sp.]MDD4660158.1 ribosome maturation factor RimM [Massilibacteroides sp.]
MIRKEELVKIGQFAKPHGVKGEISLVTSCDFFEKDNDNLFIICEMEGIFVPFFVTAYRYKSDAVVLLKMENLDSEEAVKPFVNRDVFMCREKMDEEDLGVGIVGWDRFIGYEVYDAGRGYLGIVEDVDASTMNVLFRISFEDNLFLIPVAEELVDSLDYDKKRIVLSLPQGLFEL